ncbi:MAG: hypothetical protein M0Z42_16385 [Actinomycetota bacterium]|jgi:cytochrome c biogenesis protein CcdA|nr:hypothetical protein [Actinomycetota bacterium]
MAATKREDESVREVGSDLLRLVVAYARQETVDPLRDLLRFVVWGLAGAVMTCVGGFLLSLASVRALQTELAGPLGGNLTWVPYCGGIAVALAFAGFSVTRILKDPK